MELTGTNPAGIAVSGTGSTYGIYGTSTANFAGVVGQSAPNSAAPGVYGQTQGTGPGILAVSALASLAEAASGTDPDTAAANWAGAYPGQAGIFVGDVTISGALHANDATIVAALHASSATITGALSAETTMSVGGNLTGETCIFNGGTKTAVHGVNGSGSGASPASPCGVWGDSDKGFGVYGTSHSDPGVAGSSTGGDGVRGETTSQTRAGVFGLNNSAWPCTAILGTSVNGHGVRGVNYQGSGKPPAAGCGVWGDSDQGWGVYGSSRTGTAGVFDGNVTVNGDITVSGEFDGDVTVNGNVSVTGDVILINSGQDYAEEFDLKDREIADPGTVMIIDETGALRTSDRSYDRAVAGVVSGAGAYRPGIVLDQHTDLNEARTTIALVGKVYCKVDAHVFSIAVGDLITTSDTRGHAMKVTDPSRGFGAVIGKALAPLDKGFGLLPILIALQ